jgi:transcriptional regulator with XRE-family HTH domain
MKTSPIKRARQRQVMTQAQVAAAMEVSQPTYQRWESGAVKISPKKLERLAEVLDTSTEALLGKPEPFDLFGLDPDVSADRSYFGEVSIRFAGSEKALLLPISEAARVELLSSMGYGERIMVVRSLDNRTVHLNRSSIVDIHFSSEAYDDVGPDDHEECLPPAPDDDFWRMVESVLRDGFGDEQFSEDALAAVAESVTLSEERLDFMIASGGIEASERESVRQRAKQRTDLFRRFATELRWQMRGGIVRSCDYFDARAVHEEISVLLMDEDEDEGPMLFALPIEGYDRTVAINLAQLDYISVPTHKLNDAELEAAQEALGET